MSPMTTKRAVASATICALTIATLAMVPTTAFAAPVPGDEADVGLYTNGQTDSMDIGDPTYVGLDALAPKLVPGVP